MTNVDALLDRIARLEAIEAIRALKARYFSTVDAGDFAGVRSCFMEGATVTLPGIPPLPDVDAFVDFLREAKSAGPSLSLHTGHSPRITFDGPAAAAGTWDLVFLGTLPGEQGTPSPMWLTGVYEDTYVLRGEQWLIATTEFRQGSLVSGLAARDVQLSAGSRATSLQD